MPNTEQPDFDEDFEQAVTRWRERHKLREDDAVLLLVELFRIHHIADRLDHLMAENQVFF